jgi:hypothetical protein
MARRRPYEELQRLIEQRGGTMKYTRSGHGSGGAWLVNLDGKHAVFLSNGAGFPEMDTLYVPNVASPRHHSDYSKTLVEGAPATFLGYLK